ncbi:MAG: 50S ribosomal protein L29 [Ardenticatenaceae bacterium]|nr:50S ribosomal protein L29 [Ardenticatenaceae bacterium]HBY98135.1 50S ribosomal protein L29 [Chloroflexota bacterium]
MRSEEIRDLSNAEIVQKLDEAYEKLWSMRFQLATRQLQDTNQIKQVRRDIARMKTVLREREIWAEYEAAQQAAGEEA